MKYIKTYILALMLLFIPFAQTKAAVAAIWAIWNPATATTIAIYGLASPFVARVVFPLLVKQPGNIEAGWILGLILGGVILDNDGIPRLQAISTDEAMELNLSTYKANIFNSELEEINQVLQEISMQLPENTTYEQANELWTSYSELLSEESFEVLQAIANKAANQAL